MNMFARFDENLSMTLRVIKETKRYGRTDGRTHGQSENSIPCGGINIRYPYPVCKNKRANLIAWMPWLISTSDGYRQRSQFMRLYHICGQGRLKNYLLAVAWTVRLDMAPTAPPSSESADPSSTCRNIANILALLSRL